METAFDFPNRIRNWQRAHRWFKAQGRAFSLEGRFRPKRGQEHEYETKEWIGNGSPPSSEGAPDFWAAWDVELAWRECTARSRWCLKYHYHDAMAPQPACRLIRKYGVDERGRCLELRANDWRAYMRDARLELRLILDLMGSGYAKRAA